MEAPLQCRRSGRLLLLMSCSAMVSSLAGGIVVLFQSRAAVERRSVLRLAGVGIGKGWATIATATAFKNADWGRQVRYGGQQQRAQMTCRRDA
jgi:hypothetical protein